MAQRKPGKIQRRSPKREAYDRVLIVCEGEKTEPHYFKEIANRNKLSSANIEIIGECDSAPISVARFAIERYARERKNGGQYDRVFCVIDRDSHTTYQQALELLGNTQPRDTFVAITSVPCFEYWVLLHFQYTTQPFERTERKSPCAQAIQLLKNHLVGYEKGSKNLYSELEPYLDTAIANASNARCAAGRNDTDNPTTNIDELVSYLNTLKK